ncbi:hypothetical protein LWI28_005829 [Acer negundo]|uniref:Legume lectin domain-containing protein n=1 Tax=Acer negundo TaxID=4023 RepID=A0AAD5I995_ACENE|nr:hypothetical protein LWI28_005829 [Acer negundo]
MEVVEKICRMEERIQKLEEQARVLQYDASKSSKAKLIAVNQGYDAGHTAGFNLMREYVKFFFPEGQWEKVDPIKAKEGYCFTDVGKRSFGLSKIGLHTSKFRVVVVEFDTSFDPEYGDLNGNHICIDVDSLLTVKFCNISSQNMFLNSGKKLVSWIDYDASAKRLEVPSHNEDSMVKPQINQNQPNGPPTDINVPLSMVYHSITPRLKKKAKYTVTPIGCSPVTVISDSPSTNYFPNETPGDESLSHISIKCLIFDDIPLVIGSNTLSSGTNRMGANDYVPPLDSSCGRSKYNAKGC